MRNSNMLPHLSTGPCPHLVEIEEEEEEEELEEEEEEEE